MLTSIESESENQFVMNLAKEKDANFEFIYLGGYGRSRNGNKWHWMDGEHLSVFKLLIYTDEIF